MRKKLLLIVAGLVLIGALFGYFHVRSLGIQENGQLKASGTIESVTIKVSPEMAGKVKEVLVKEGQPVKAGDPILLLDDSLLAAQRTVALSQLDSAKAGVQTAQDALVTAKRQYQVTLEAALAQGKKTRLQDWFSDPKLFDQPGWYYTRAEQIQAMQVQVEVAQKAVEDAQTNLANVSQSLEQADFLKAEQRLLDARLAYLVAKNVNSNARNSAAKDTPKGLYNRTHCGTNDGYFVDNANLTNLIYKCTGDEHLGDSGRALYDKARVELEDAQNSYNELLTSSAANKVLQARADVSVAQERYYSALDFLRNLQTGDQSPEVAAAQGAVDQAQSAVEQAQKAVGQAQANVDLIDIQLAKIKVTAPMDGVILTRNAQPGEFVQPSAAVVTMANLKDLTITVYIPEDRYGQISLGQRAAVTVDSFPGEVFTGEVFYISDQAEFTPRNVQTAEGRNSTVYAIKLKVTDPQSKLKIGMPSDVTFLLPK